MSRGRDRRLGYMSKHLEDIEEKMVHQNHGLVSSVYDLAASGDYIPVEEARRRNRKALKDCIATHGFYETRVRVKSAVIPSHQETARQNLISILDTLG